MHTGITFTQLTPSELENLVERAIKKQIDSICLSKIDVAPKQHYTKREAAAELSCSVPMIDKLIQQGRLEKIKVGAKVLIPREGINRILSNKKRVEK